MSGPLAHAHGGASHLPSLAVRLGLDSGVHRLLETPLVINGAEGSTILRFLGSQAAAAGWPEYGGAGTLTLQAGTAPTYGVASPYLGALDGGVKGNSGGWFQGAGLGNITTHDFAVELVFQIGINTTEQIFATQQGTAKGWVIYTGSTGTTVNGYTKGDAVGSAFTLATAGGSLLHVLWIYDSSGSSIGYVNNVASAAVDVSARGSLTTTNPLYLGHYVAGAFSSTILFAALHARASGWLDSHLQPTLAAQRFALLTASRPAFSVVPSTYPSSAGSTSPVYQQRRLVDGTDRLFYMGAGSPTFDRIVDSAGRAVVAHLVEAAAIQRCAYSELPGHASWSPTGLSVSTTPLTLPDGRIITTATLKEPTGGTFHYVGRADLTATPGATYCFSAIVKAINRSWFDLNLYDAPGDLDCYFNLATGATGTVAAAFAAAGSISLGNSLWRVWATHEVVNAGLTFQPMLANANNGRSYSGANQDSIQISMMQAEIGDYPSSYVPTTNVHVTRAASVCKYSATNCFPRAEGTVIGAILCRSFTPSRARVLFSISDGSTANEVQIFTTATTGLLSASSRKAAGTSGDVELTASGSVYTNAIIPVMVAWRQGELALWARISGVWVRAQDLTVDAVAGATFTTFAAGSDGAGANQCGPGAYWLAGWETFPQFFSDPSAVRSGVDTLWQSY